MIYSSKNEYIAQVITPALGDYAAEHDIDQIACEMLIWHDEAESSGDINLGRSGFIEDGSKDFWAVVEANAA